jgi:hypothetical protein
VYQKNILIVFLFSYHFKTIRKTRLIVFRILIIRVFLNYIQKGTVQQMTQNLFPLKAYVHTHILHAETFLWDARRPIHSRISKSKIEKVDLEDYFGEKIPASTWP